MAIERISPESERRFLESVARDVALRRAHREIKMLLAMVPKDQPAVGTFHCPVCFRDVPHSPDIHVVDKHYLDHLNPEILANINR
jgi:hypothetical protein